MKTIRHFPTLPEMELAKLLKTIIAAGALTESLSAYALKVGDENLAAAIETVREHLLEAGAEVHDQRQRENV